MKPALFLDRDGVINLDKGYVYRKRDIVFIDGIFKVCEYFQNIGYFIVIITNQAGIARGIYTESEYKILTKWIVAKFNARGVDISGVYHCPHHPDFTGTCLCRKPNPGMISKAAKDLSISLPVSIFVGDKQTDMLAAINAGILNRVLYKTSDPNVLDVDNDANETVRIDSLHQLENIFS